MSPKKSKTTKPSLKKSGTMKATAAAGEDYLKRSWGTKRYQQHVAFRDTYSEQVKTLSEQPKAKPKLAKTKTMQNTTEEAKELLGKEVLADTRQETKRRQAAAVAKKARENAKKPKTTKKPALKRLGTMAKTAKEGKAYVKRTGKKTTGRKPTASRTKKSTK